MTGRNTPGETRELRDAVIRYEAHVKMTNETLGKIDKHLERLNGTVARHQSTLDREFPRTIDGCPQRETIEELKQNMISAKAIKRTIFAAVGITGTLVSIAFVLYQILTSK